MSERRWSSGFQLDSLCDVTLEHKGREEETLLYAGSLFLSPCQREIAALGALELHRITQNINMQIAFFREGNFISAGKSEKPVSFLYCALPGAVLSWGWSGPATVHWGMVQRDLNLVRVLSSPLVTHP